MSDREFDVIGIFGRLDKLKPTGKDRWKACCPSHDDKSPSLQIAIAGDGRILMHCFSGCSINEICSVIGIEVADLFPEKTHYKSVRQPVNVPTEDDFFIEVIKAQARRREPITEQDKLRYLAAVNKRAIKK